MEAARHLPFIAASYGALAVIVGGLILWLGADYRAQARALAELEGRRPRRRSEQGTGAQDRQEQERQEPGRQEPGRQEQRHDG